MEPENLTVRVLMDIRDEMRGMREDITGMRADIHGLREEQIHTNERLAVVETVLVDVATQMRFLGRSMGVSRVARRRHEQRLEDLERRVGDLERKR